MAVWTNCFGKWGVGAYEGTWKGAPFGLMEGPWRWQQNISGLDIRCSLYGEVVVDSVYLGSNEFIIGLFKEWTPGCIAAMFPYVKSPNVWPHMGPIGQLMSDAVDGPAGALRLAAVPNTPAAVHGPAILYSGKASAAPGSTLEIPFGYVERLVPIVFKLWPQRDVDGHLYSAQLTDPTS